CVPETTSFDGPTRDGIKIFKEINTPDQVPTDKIELSEERKDLIRMGHGRACPEGAQNYFELKRFFLRGELLTDQVKKLQQLLNEKSESSRITESGQLDLPTRRKIAAFRQKLKDLGNNLGDPASAEGQVTKSLWSHLNAL
ncbi:MAG: hypothetical protein L0220_20715, partial [Acidobacteria bacterium]|nr:hypothetical protein [Acidobacteriota bacterium]